MHRSISPRGRIARLSLEILEGRWLPGESVLSVILGGLAAEQFGLAPLEIAPPQSTCAV